MELQEDIQMQMGITGDNVRLLKHLWNFVEQIHGIMQM